MYLRLLFVLPLLVAFFSCDPGPPPSPEGVVSGDPTCAECRIERKLVATINDSNFPGGAMGDYSDVQVNSDGSFLVLTGKGFLWDAVYLADRNGSIYRQLGNQGEGPGEYRRPQFTMETPSSYLVTDSRLLRLTQFAKSDLTVEATSRIPHQQLSGIAPIAFPDGSYLISDNTGMVNINSPEGEVLNTFQVGFDTLSGNTEPPHHFSTSGESSFWVSFGNRHRVEKWDRSGELLASLEREADWVQPRTPESKAGDSYTQIWAVQEDDLGRLWLHYEKSTLVERTRVWISADGSQSNRSSVVPDTALASKEARVEVIELADRRVLASLQIPGWTGKPQPGSFNLTVWRTPETIIPLVEVWGFEFHDGRG